MKVIKDNDFWYFINEKGESLKIEANSFYDTDRLKRELDEKKRENIRIFIYDNFAALSIALTILCGGTIIYLAILVKKLIDFKIFSY